MKKERGAGKKIIAVILILCMACILFDVLCAGAAKSVPLFSAVDGYVSFEAEKIYYSTNIFTLTVDMDASGVRGLFTKEGFSSESSIGDDDWAEFQVKADQKGTYAVWMRMKPTSSNKTMYVKIDDNSASTIAISGSANQYEWICVGTKAFDANQIRHFKIAPKNGYFTVDKVVVTNDLFSEPTGADGTLQPIDTTLTETYYNKPEFTPPPEHPRLYFMKDDIAQILSNSLKTENSAALSTHKANLVKDIDGILPAAEEGKSNLNNSWLGIIESWAFEYVIAENEEYGRKAIDAVKNYARTVVFIDPFDDAYTRNAGHLVFTMAQVYDWCYPLLTDEDKDYIISQAIFIIKNGIEVSWPPIKQGSLTGHGSEAQILRDILSFAIAVYDERPDIYTVVGGRFFDKYLPARAYHYNSHLFHQGTLYGGYRGQWDYNATWIFDRMGYEKVFGDNQQMAAYWYVYMTRPDGLVFADGDKSNNGYTPGVSRDVTFRRVLFLASNYYKDPYLKYAAQKVGAGTLGYGHGNTSPVEFLIFNNPNITTISTETLPQTKYFDSPAGNMVARTGWEEGLDVKTAVAYMKVGELWFANHHHLDSGHFQLYYKGILASDSGRYSAYGSSHDYTYNKRTIAHNTILVYDPSEVVSYYGGVNDGGQRIPGGEQSSIDALLAADYKFGEVEGHEFGPDAVKPEYSYLKGDITKAYSSNKMSEFERSFMFYNLNNDDHPAALIVFDRVVSTDASFKKTWLLHGLFEPTVIGNQTVFRNDDLGYNGKLTVDTLIPHEDNAQIDIVGGMENEFYVNGVNYPAYEKNGELSSPLNMQQSHETDGYRIELSPKTPSKTDYFLNVLQVSDSEPDLMPLKTDLIENDNIAGAKIGDRVCIFSKSKGRSSNNVEFSFSGDGNYKINVADVKTGNWDVYRGGEYLATVRAADESGLLSFEGEAGSYVITYKNMGNDIDLPITIGAAVKRAASNGNINLSTYISGTSDNAIIMLAIYDNDKKLHSLTTQRYMGKKNYTFEIDSTLKGKKAVVMVWSGEYDSVPLSATYSTEL